jgi:cold shock CspA family protein
MKLPLQIVFRNIKKSGWIEQLVQERATKLDSFCNDIMRCRIIVEMPHRHHRQGNLVLVRIEITVPGKEIAVNREAAGHASYEDINTALRDAFDSAKRQLEDYVRRRRRAVKSHTPAPHARIRQLVAEDGYGFLETPDGREIYFHANSLINEKFDQLAIGREVAFVEEQGDKGAQASTVRVIKKAPGRR